MGAEARPIRRVVFVSRVKRNPYVSLLAEGLTQLGLGIEPKIVDRFSLGWMWANRRSVDVLHLHWLELLYIYPSWKRSIKRWLSVMLALCLARICGIRLVYTLHNLEQHEGRRPKLARLANHVIFRLACAIHVHDSESQRVLGSQWGRVRGVYVIPHGNYAQAYPQSLSREQARKQLALGSREFVYLFLGRIRPYKGVEDLLQAFSQLADDDARLVIAGEVHDPGYEQALQELRGSDSRIQLVPRFIQDDEVQIYLRASDISVLPYRHVTTSGAALLSFSFAVPIIAPRMGCLADLVGDDGERGLGYEAGNPNGLIEALRRARTVNLASMREACAGYSADLNWDRIAAQHAAMYKQCTQDV